MPRDRTAHEEGITQRPGCCGNRARDVVRARRSLDDDDSQEAGPCTPLTWTSSMSGRQPPAIQVMGRVGFLPRCPPPGDPWGRCRRRKDDGVGVRHERDRASTLVGLSVRTMVPEIEDNAAARDDGIDLGPVPASRMACSRLSSRTMRPSRAAAFLVVRPVGTTEVAFWSAGRSRSHVSDLGLLETDDLRRSSPQAFDHFVDDEACEPGACSVERM